VLRCATTATSTGDEVVDVVGAGGDDVVAIVGAVDRTVGWRRGGGCGIVVAAGCEGVDIECYRGGLGSLFLDGE